MEDSSPLGKTDQPKGKGLQILTDGDPPMKLSGLCLKSLKGNPQLTSPYAYIEWVYKLLILTLKYEQTIKGSLDI